MAELNKSSILLPHKILPPHAIIILASGLSERLGQPKQLLKKKSQSLLEVMVNISIATQPQFIAVVVPSSSQQILQLIQILSVKHPTIEPVINRQPKLGMGHSLSLAIDKLNSKVEQGELIERVLILGIDQIMLDISHLLNLLTDKTSIAGEAINQSNNNKLVIASGYPTTYIDNINAYAETYLPYNAEDNAKDNVKDDEPYDKNYVVGLPINLDYKLLKQWQSALIGDKGLRYLIRHLPTSKLDVIYNAKLSLDIDTPDQLAFARDKGWLD